MQIRAKEFSLWLFNLGNQLVMTNESSAGGKQLKSMNNKLLCCAACYGKADKDLAPNR